MKVLLIHRYFWPDTPPYASMLLAIAKQLVRDGHHVEVFTSLPSYKSGSEELLGEADFDIDGIHVTRIGLFPERKYSKFFKLLNMIYFPLRIILHGFLNRSIDVIMSSTAPPVVTGFSCALTAKFIDAKFIYHCMDIHPEIGAISGEFNNSYVYNLLLKMDMWTCLRSEKIIVLSNDMKKSLQSRTLNSTLDIQVINNFSLIGSSNSSSMTMLDSQFQKKEGVFRILFAGNIGRFQMLDSFVDAMCLLKDLPNLELIFLGEGAALKGLKEQAGDMLGRSIKFFPHQDINTARMIMAGANLGVVSLLPKIYHYALPSKTMTYLAEGCPLLVTVEPESELVDYVKKNDIGITCLPGDAIAIANAIRTVVRDESFSKNISQRCIELAEKQFSEVVVLKQWTSLYGNLS